MAIAHLHILFAKNAPVGVIFRRGPSKQVRLILWHTDTDTFEMGQWLKGTIYGHNAALSPNGKLLAYFAADWRWNQDEEHSLRRQSETQNAKDISETWVAVRRPPYLTALALWFTRWGTYGGAATFANNHTLLLSEAAGEPAPGREPPSEFNIGKIPPTYDYLVGRGWRPSPLTRGFYEKSLPGGFGVLGYRPYDDAPTLDKESREKFWLRDNHSGYSNGLEADYAEIDPSGRLVLAQDGKLFAALPNDDMTVTKTEIADFNAMVFEPIAPTDWAKEWPDLSP